MSHPTMPQTHTPLPRVVAISVALAVVLSVILLAFLWPTVTSSVRALPVAIAAPAAQAERLTAALEERSPGTFDVTVVDNKATAVDLIETRHAYGAIVLGPAPEVLTASAASPVVSQLLTGLAPALAAQLNAAAAAQGQQLTEPITVSVTDVVALAETDSRGVGLAASSFPLVLGGMIGGIAISMVIVGVWRRVIATVIHALAGGFAITGILQGWFGAFQGNYLVNTSAVALTILAISGTIVGCVSVFGRAGIAVGPVLFLLVANPISAASQPVEFLAAPWGAIGQWFPPGAAATLLRDLSYFPRADTLFPWLVLAGWAVLGLLLSTLGHYRDRGGATSEALAAAE